MQIFFLFSYPQCRKTALHRPYSLSYPVSSLVMRCKSIDAFSVVSNSASAGLAVRHKCSRPAQVQPRYIPMPCVKPVRIPSTPRKASLSCHGKRYLKHSAAISVVGTDHPFMQMDNLLRQSKADAGFTAPPHVEAVKDVGQVRFGDAVPIVTCRLSTRQVKRSSLRA